MSSTHPYDPNPSSEPGGYQSAAPRLEEQGQPDRQSLMTSQREQFGGVKIGAAFLGWVTSVGAMVLLVALAAFIVEVFNLGRTVISSTVREVGLGFGITLLVIFFLAYYCGGYVAGRMARFTGARQGFTVWLWGIVVAIIATLVSLVVGTQGTLNSRLDVVGVRLNASNINNSGWIILAIFLVVTLVGAILGGLAGMRYHRRVDRAGFNSAIES